MPTVDLSPEEARHILKRRRSAKRDAYFREGLVAAANHLMLWDGATDTQKQMVADQIMRLRRPRNIRPRVPGANQKED
jgi:hypothetical protein